jgi:hypothetical protein
MLRVLRPVDLHGDGGVDAKFASGHPPRAPRSPAGRPP